MNSLPKFKYFMSPYIDGIFEAYESVCSCCGQHTEFSYEHSLGPFCPWCIETGNAAKKFDIKFIEVNDYPKDVPQEVIDVLIRKTPAYSTWQGIKWKFHCKDACIFEGDLSVDETKNPNWQAVGELMQRFGLKGSSEEWKDISDNYRIADPSIFKFSCIHCGAIFYDMDIP